jgi:hypothetical protein
MTDSIGSEIKLMKTADHTPLDNILNRDISE